jgi:hypothetical protein
MNRKINIIPVLLICISIPTWGDTPAQQTAPAKEKKCDKPTGSRGELKWSIDEKDPEKHDPRCIQLSRQDSILWESKNHEFSITLTPINPDTGEPIGEPDQNPPFYRSGTELKSVGKLLSSGPPKLDLFKDAGSTEWLYYDVKITLQDQMGKAVLDEQGNPIIIDPHLGIKP